MTDPHPIAAAIRDALIAEEEIEPGLTEVTNLVDALLHIAAALNRIADRMPI